MSLQTVISASAAECLASLQSAGLGRLFCDAATPDIRYRVTIPIQSLRRVGEGPHRLPAVNLLLEDPGEFLRRACHACEATGEHDLLELI